MGPKKDPKLWINTKKLGRKIIPCNEEMLALLACFKKCDFAGTESKCAGERKRLDACLMFQAKQPTKKNTINHHLQRLARAARR